MNNLANKTVLILLLLSVAIIGHAQKKSPKRGISYEIPFTEDLPVLSKGISWFYNWGVAPGKTAVAAVSDEYLDFVPMAWNNAYDRTKLRNYLTAHPNVKYILGFNEPNFKAQANMTPTQAAAAWPELEAIADEFGLKIVGPAVNYAPANGCVSENGVNYTDPFKYLDDFFAAGPQCRVDIIAVHSYMNDPNAVEWYVNEFIKKYNKPVWLTEFCAWEYNAPLTTNKATGYAYQRSSMIRKIEVLEHNPMIERYAWFIPRTNNEVSFPYMQLLRNKQTDPMYELVGPGVLTDLGKVFVNMSSFDSTYYSGVNQEIPAKDYIQSFWAKLETTTDSTSLIPIQLCEFDSGIFTDYFIDVPSAGHHMLNLRISNLAGINPKFKIYSNGNLLTTQEVASTGGFENWATRSLPITLPAGKQTLRISSSGASGCKMVWFSLTDQTDIKNTQKAECHVFVDNNHNLQIISCSSISKITLYDFSGNVVFRGPWNKEANLSSYKDGIYFLKIEFDTKQSFTCKLRISNTP